MILQSARLALQRLPSPEFRGVLWKSLGLTLAALALVWVGLREIITFIGIPWLETMTTGLPGWIDAWSGTIGLFAGVAASLALAVLLAFLIAPTTAVIAGLFLDDAAEVIEREDYPDHPVGRAMPLGQSIILSVKFLGIVLAANLVALVLLLVPGINIAAFFLANGYVLGREYFTFAAMRYRSEAEARALRRKHSGTVFAAGLLIAGFLAIPLVNLLAPLFAAALMVHLHKALEGSSRTA